MDGQIQVEIIQRWPSLGRNTTYMTRVREEKLQMVRCGEKYFRYSKSWEEQLLMASVVENYNQVGHSWGTKLHRLREFLDADELKAL